VANHQDDSGAITVGPGGQRGARPSTASDRLVELRALDAQHAPKVDDEASGATGNCGGIVGGGIERLPSMGSRYGVVVRGTLLARDFYTSGRK
jgi:hypothetical protein